MCPKLTRKLHLKKITSYLHGIINNFEISNEGNT